MKELRTPIKKEEIEELSVGEQVLLSGVIYTGRDAVLPKIVQLIRDNQLDTIEAQLEGSVIFHTAVSPAGVGPTSSNKLDIEESTPILAKAGVRLHLGKGRLKNETIQALKEESSAYATLPPVTALLASKILKKRVIAFPEEGMEALYELTVEKIPIIIAGVNGKSITEEGEKE